MDNTQIDSFLEYITLVEEGAHQFSQEQVKKLELIKSKVSELVKRTEIPVRQSASQSVPVAQKVMAEKKVQTFSQFFAVNETIVKSGKDWLVKDKKKKKTLGTHPSKKAALKQLQAIEISKHAK